MNSRLSSIEWIKATAPLIERVLFLYWRKGTERLHSPCRNSQKMTNYNGTGVDI